MVTVGYNSTIRNVFIGVRSLVSEDSSNLHLRKAITIYAGKSIFINYYCSCFSVCYFSYCLSVSILSINNDTATTIDATANADVTTNPNKKISKWTVHVRNPGNCQWRDF